MAALAAAAPSPTPAFADVPETIRFSYEAAAEVCPSRDAFVGMVGADGGGFSQAPDGTDARTFTVTLAASRVSSSRQGHRSPARRERKPYARSIEGAQTLRRCGPFARGLHGPFLEPQPELRDDPRGRPRRPWRTNPRRQSRLHGKTFQCTTGPRLPGVSRPAWRVGPAAQGTMTGGASPGVMWGVAASIEIVRNAQTGFTPAFRLGVELGGAWAASSLQARSMSSGSFPTPSPGAAFERRVVRLDACPLRSAPGWRWSQSPVEFQACVRLSAGTLGASPTNVEAPREVQVPWLATGAVARIRWVIEHRVFIELEGGILFPLLRESFVADPGSVVYSVPAAGGTFGSGVGSLSFCDQTRLDVRIHDRADDPRSHRRHRALRPRPIRSGPRRGMQTGPRSRRTADCAASSPSTTPFSGGPCAG